MFNRSIEPLYLDSTCPYLDRQVACVENGRLDLNYQRWEWQPDDCILPRYLRRTFSGQLHTPFTMQKSNKPTNSDSIRVGPLYKMHEMFFRFNPERALKRLRGKRLLFVGDSLQRGQWQSFVCMVDSVIPPGKKSLRRGRTHSVFRALVIFQMDYNK